MNGVVARASAASRDSILFRGITGLVAIGRSATVARQATRTFDEETVWFVHEISSARIGRAAAALVDAVGRAWSDAAAHHMVEAAGQRLRDLGQRERVRLFGIWLLTVAVTDAVLTVFDPRPASTVRWCLWAAVLAIGTFAAWRPNATATAWADWRVRRMRS